MAASLIALSALPHSPPSLLARIPAGTFPIFSTTFLSSFQTLRSPSMINRHLHRRRSRRGDQAVVRAGQPSASTLFLVFVLPLSLLIGTILVSIRIGNKLDEKFLEELAVNQALMEESEEEAEVEEKEDLDMREEEEVGANAVRIRNRPKREV
ncbi:uncharacterized protein LOC110034930 [Phalaenopsis equestris]|uniref:uncharacterized protein LOC110034930 n=1 Tax=Phalaenopsis equestris TaxID=78828 RepID=UPI0009E545AF|nr:uncharacterized protein LOC110034930 [Phalaenopsis equestris]